MKRQIGLPFDQCCQESSTYAEFHSHVFDIASGILQMRQYFLNVSLGAAKQVKPGRKISNNKGWVLEFGRNIGMSKS